MKVKLFTHTDLDGVGCKIVADHAWGAENVDVEYCDYKEVDDKVKGFIDSREYMTYDLVLITDISVNQEVAELIDTTINYDMNYEPELILLDHHATASWLNKYWWANVTPVKVVELPSDPIFETSFLPQELKTAGISMLYDYVVNNNDLNDYANVVSDFVEKVRRWDTWDWHNVFKDEFPKRLNNLLYLIGRKKFVERYSQNLDLTFTEGEELVLSIEEDKIKNYIAKVSKNIIPIAIEDYNVGAVFAEQYLSELGNALAEQNPELDFIVMLNMGGKGISYRGVKDDIDLGQVASWFGGGGHAKAAGSSINEKMVNHFAQVCFDKNVLALLSAVGGENE